MGYVTGKPVDVAVKGCDSNGTPWSRPQDSASGNKVVENLNYIQDVLLRRHDPTLCARLEKLEIFPQIYGIRWLRLLFGREFVFRDTLILWDAIFADSCPPRLCDQLVVSLLMAVRDLLLKYEYQDAVQLLMKLPSNLSVSYCTQFALHLKDPLRFPKPSGSAFAHGVVKAGREKKKVINKSDERFRKISAPKKLFSKIPTEATKTPFELVRPMNTPASEPDSASDFTVLDVRNDAEDGDENPVPTDQTVKPLNESQYSSRHVINCYRNVGLIIEKGKLNQPKRYFSDVANDGDIGIKDTGCVSECEGGANAEDPLSGSGRF